MQKKVIANVPVGEFPEGIDFDSETQQILVANWSDNSVSVIDASNHQLVNTIATGNQSRAFGQFIMEASH
jgi:YVTN family beta-propeller protein